MKQLLDDAPVLEETDEPDESEHLVCHCTNYNVAACGIFLADVPLLDAEEENEDDDCPLCWLRWPNGSTCPWGCRCLECLV